jgi:hypothetical protein
VPFLSSLWSTLVVLQICSTFDRILALPADVEPFFGDIGKKSYSLTQWQEIGKDCWLGDGAIFALEKERRLVIL